jgi:hypothetical protein
MGAQTGGEEGGMTMTDMLTCTARDAASPETDLPVRPAQLAEAFEFLDDLRSKGTVNMFGASICRGCRPQGDGRLDANLQRVRDGR